MNFKYHNPVRIEFGVNKLMKLSELVGGRKALFVTTQGFIKRGILEKIADSKKQIVHTVDSIPANPTFRALRDVYAESWAHDFEVIVALGGGSVLDGAKALSVYDGSRKFEFVENMIRGKSEKKGYRLIPIIAIPTTAGTGSELTPWATIWDMDEKKKYSLHLPDLWAEYCICDPSLTLSLPRDITIQTSLDALSQSLESIWNRNANPVSTRFAITAAKEILEVLPALAEKPDDIMLRTRQMWACMNTGLAFSNTQTAVAHAISYYVTAHKGTAHGIACSFTLPDVAETFIGYSESTDRVFMEIFGVLSGEPLQKLMTRLGVKTNFRDYGLTESDLLNIRKSLKGNPRANNSLVDEEKLFRRLGLS